VLTRLGLRLPSVGMSRENGPDEFARVVEVARTAERSGFDSLWVEDLDLGPRGTEGSEDAGFEAYTLLGAIAVCTDSVRLGALVTSVTQRRPALLAKQVTALDVLSAGRAVLGVGAGPQRLDPSGTGDPVETGGLRFDRLSEALQIFRSMFRDSPVDFRGQNYELEGATNRPRPTQTGGPPILIAADGADRALQLAAEHADACNVSGDIATVSNLITALEAHCIEIGRDLSSITKTILISGDDKSVAEQVAAYREVGIDGIILDIPDVDDPSAVADAGAIIGGAMERGFEDG
jgi:alkanesulfonate monooxygenase SsuD/methylene tetrahydromethanopterin reductase-like flavin-dependent oxidoreductase (luciferase family)